MKTSIISRVKTTFTCGRCSMMYLDYKHLLEHLYWRHGTESVWCKECSVKRWLYAPHECHVLPIYEILEDDPLPSEDSPDQFERETDFCFCKKFVPDAPMIGCDGPNCQIQWYHFSCVGVITPPEGNWFCPTCDKTQQINQVIPTSKITFHYTHNN
ncbi:hypothetical protein PYW08_001594 [Mythimna loreyi]|uniref:Uncharacterized protein n=1 Tax=Mythimna loreyi TaxID=667449 RepID=A0ACC2R4G0_9NEOP|nr:hypothetical protein PYW08_001594 [Mythimna loreyi]